jgi:transketolase
MNSATAEKKPRLTTSAMIASIASEGQRVRAAPFGKALVEYAASNRPKWSASRGPGQIHRPASVRAGLPGALLPDGHGRAVADGRGRRHGQGRAVPFATTYAVFGTRRAYDFIHQVIAEENLNVKICCALPGLTTGYGPSHQATEDIAMMRGMPGLTIVDPCDALDIEQMVPQIAAHKGPVYMRLLRGNVPLVLDEIRLSVRARQGQAAARRRGRAGHLQRPHDDACPGDSEGPRADKIDVAVLHCPTIKPLDEAAIVEAVRYKPRLVVVAENHSVVGGLGEAVASALLRQPRSACRLPAGRPAGRVPRRRRAADAARPLRHQPRSAGAAHQGLAGVAHAAPDQSLPGRVASLSMALDAVTQMWARRAYSCQW